MMLRCMVIATLSVLIATSALAQTVQSQAQNRASTKHLKPPKQASAYSTNPDYDVYVRGEYVGSDPDPRIRATIRQEATRSYGNGLR